MTAETVKCRPMIFSGPMVRAILEGRKTQTRRLMKPQPPAWIEDLGYTAFTPGGYISGRGTYRGEPAEKFFRGPKWAKGERLWVREAFAESSGRHIFKADFNLEDGFGSEVIDTTTGECVPLVWKPSIHMPRIASRITLEITDVRVERLREISEADKLAEGATPSMLFGTVWRMLHTKPGTRWEDSPWVWVISFRRLIS